MSIFDSIQVGNITDTELNRLVYLYRRGTVSLIGIGIVLLYLMIGHEGESDFLVLLFLLNFIFLMPAILRSNTLHKEMRRRISEKRRRRKKRKTITHINIKLNSD